MAIDFIKLLSRRVIMVTWRYGHLEVNFRIVSAGVVHLLGRVSPACSIHPLEALTSCVGRVMASME